MIVIHFYDADGNLFQNLVKCGYCGGSMVFVNKGKSPKGGTYLVCDNGRRGVTCKAHQVRYEEFEQTMLNNLHKLRPEAVLPNSNEKTARAKMLRDGIAASAAETSEIESSIKNLFDQIEQTANAALRARYEQRITELEAKKTAVESECAKKRGALQELERSETSFIEWQKNLAGLKDAITKDVENRIRLRSHLKEFIQQIDVFANGHKDTVEHAEALIHDCLPEVERAASFAAFTCYMRSRFLSADARFFRLHLCCAKPNCAGLQIAPESSLAGGCYDSWQRLEIHWTAN